MKKYLCVIMSILLLTVMTGCSQPSNFSGGGRDEVIYNNTSIKEDLNEVNNIVTDELNTDNESKTINPLPSTIDLQNITSYHLNISLENGNIDTDNKLIKTKIYDYELFDIVDLSRMQIGDTIVINNNQLVIESIEHTDSGSYLINGGLDIGGYELITDDSTVYYSIGYSDYIEYYEIGEMNLPISDNFIFTDATDLDNDPITYNLSDINNADYTGNPHNLTLVVEDGMATMLYKRYTP